MNLRQPKRKPRAPCKVEGCDRPCKGLGLCSSHYQKKVRARTVTEKKTSVQALLERL